MSKVALKKGPWTPKEDKKLIAYVTQHGHGNWISLPSGAGLQRSGRSCRLRWINYLKPDIKRGNFSLEEERTIIQLHALLGNKWSTIAAQLPKRTDNEIKNYWNAIIKKKLIKMGIDPITHKPIANKDGVNVINHMAEWERVRLEAEARSSSMLSSTSTRPARLIISKVPMTQPLGSCSSSESLSTNAMYNMCALTLSTGDDDLQQQLSFSSSRREVPNNIVEDFTERSLSLSYQAESDSNNNSIRESSGQDNMTVMLMDGYVSNFQDDDDLMVAVQAFTKTVIPS